MSVCHPRRTEETKKREQCQAEVCYSPKLHRRSTSASLRNCLSIAISSTDFVAAQQQPCPLFNHQTWLVWLKLPVSLSLLERFGQLQEVDLTSVEPALGADTEVNSFRDDTLESFRNRDAMVNAVPSYEEPYIKVPKVLNKE